MDNYARIEDLIGVTLKAIDNSTGDKLIFVAEDGREWIMSHQQDCCESVSIDDVCGDLSDLIGSPIVMAEESASSENPDGIDIPEYQESFTWTFYKLATHNGYVTIRWYGESNGYYSEGVDFCLIKQPAPAEKDV